MVMMAHRFAHGSGWTEEHWETQIKELPMELFIAIAALFAITAAFVAGAYGE